ncbi:sepiapterin reductase-like [Ornithodoros turicata]|uniref:sepiapterin reductase-like n=1 Tax=Ornithodoros turicata TaxID=34597 RepID=UPI003138692F
MADATGDSTDLTDKFWGKKCLVLITGGSRGIGRVIAVEFAKRLAKDSVVVITGRNVTGLQDTQRMIESGAEHVKVLTVTCDHLTATYEDYVGLISRTSKNVEQPEKAILVHNAATIGDVSKYAASYNDPNMIDDYMHLNLTSVMLLTSAFLKHYPQNSGTARAIINITSLAGRKPFPGLGLYSCGKAAREMYLNVLAVENPTVKVLHYSPGPVKTDMQDEMQNAIPELRSVSKGFRQSALAPETTVERLVNILDRGGFDSGACIDFFDRA